MVLVLRIESEEIGLIPADTACEIIAIAVVIAHIGIERGIAVEGLRLARGQTREPLCIAIYQTLPT